MDSDKCQERPLSICWVASAGWHTLVYSAACSASKTAMHQIKRPCCILFVHIGGPVQTTGEECVWHPWHKSERISAAEFLILSIGFSNGFGHTLAPIQWGWFTFCLPNVVYTSKPRQKVPGQLFYFSCSPSFQLRIGIICTIDFHRGADSTQNTLHQILCEIPLCE